MRINDEARELIKRFEGLRLNAYLCPAGVWTIGYGSTGAHVSKGLQISESEADELLRKDLERFESGVERLVRVPLTDGQFGALVSLAFNIGLGAFQKSTLLRMLNAGDYAGAQAQFAAWRKAGGKVLPGLVNRRASEAALFGRGEFVSSRTVEPDGEQSIVKTKTVTGAILSAGAGVAGLADMPEAVDSAAGVVEAAQQASYLATPGGILSALLVAIIIGGLALTIYGRWKARQKSGV